MRRLALLLAAIGASTLLLAACQSSTPPGIPVSGKLTVAGGSNAPLTVGASTPVPAGSDFSMSATIGSALVVETSQPWICFAPDPPQFLNFDIQASDQTTWGLFISISPKVWSSGAIAIDNTNVALLVETPDRYGFVTTGTIQMTSAPKVADAGQVCSFTIQNARLSGQRSAGSPP